MSVKDRRKMIAYISSQLPDGEGRLFLAQGASAGEDIITDVTVYGDDLDIQTNCPDCITVHEIYDHLRWRAMPSWEQKEWIRGVIAETRLILLQQRLANYDAVHNSAPFRFQKFGKMWVVHFTAPDVFEKGVFKGHRGFQHYAKLLANPDRRILSLELAGRLDLIASGIVAAESALSPMTQHTPQAIENYKRALEKLKDDHEGARLRGDIEAMDRISGRIEELEKRLWGDGKRTFTRLRRLKTGGRTIPQKIHSSVGQAMRRAIAELMNGGMRKCAAFIERYVEPPDGESYIYRPPSPAPVWLV